MNVFLTGATGLLGGELLVTLSKKPEINKIYCLIRSNNEEEAVKRIAKVFDLHKDFYDKNKIKVILGDLLDENLTSSLIENKEIADTNYILHSAANTSFSRIYDDLVEKVNIHGLNKIVQWAKQLKNLNTFIYVGTATICGKNMPNQLILEDYSPNKEAKHVVKYTYTKTQGEFLLRNELPNDKLLFVRPSIIMSDSRDVIPRSPVILWALATFNALRLCTFNEQSKLDIISVDFASEAITKLIFAKRNYNVYHVSSGIESATSPYQTLMAIEPFFKGLPEYKFIDKSFLSEFKKWAKGNYSSEKTEPFAEYLTYWESRFNDKSKLRIIYAGLEPYIEFIELSQIFDNSRLLHDIDIKPPVPSHQYITKSVEYIKNINILEGAFDA